MYHREISFRVSSLLPNPLLSKTADDLDGRKWPIFYYIIYMKVPLVIFWPVNQRDRNISFHWWKFQSYGMAECIVMKLNTGQLSGDHIRPNSFSISTSLVLGNIQIHCHLEALNFRHVILLLYWHSHMVYVLCK